MLVLEKINPVKHDEQLSKNDNQSCLYDTEHLYVIISTNGDLSSISDSKTSANIRGLTGAKRKNVYLQLAQLVKNLHNSYVSILCLDINSITVDSDLKKFSLIGFESLAKLGNDEVLFKKVSNCMGLALDLNEHSFDIVKQDLANLVQIFLFLDPNVFYAFVRNSKMDVIAPEDAMIVNYLSKIYEHVKDATVEYLTKLVKLAFKIGESEREPRFRCIDDFNCGPDARNNEKGTVKTNSNALFSLYISVFQGKYDTVLDFMIALESIPEENFDGPAQNGSYGVDKYQIGFIDEDAGSSSLSRAHTPAQTNLISLIRENLSL